MFYSDKPISSNSDDLLKRSGFAKLLAETIASLDKKDFYCFLMFVLFFALWLEAALRSGE